MAPRGESQEPLTYKGAGRGGGRREDAQPARPRGCHREVTQRGGHREKVNLAVLGDGQREGPPPVEGDCQDSPSFPPSSNSRSGYWNDSARVTVEAGKIRRYGKCRANAPPLFQSRMARFFFPLIGEPRLPYVDM